MKSPFTGHEMKVAKEWRDMTFRKDTFSVLFHSYICDKTGEQFEDEHFSTLNYNQVVNQYRVRHHIPFPEQVCNIRLKYELSASKMSEILGMGANSWRNYESGEIPSKANANLIQMISQPENFRDYIQKYSELEEKERDKILKHIEKQRENPFYCNDQLYCFQNQPDMSSGFKSFDREKTKQVIFFFAERLKPYKTKMNKLLFYTDFVHFRSNVQSITGLKYVAIPHGPVPNNYEILFSRLTEEEIIDIDWTMTEYGLIERFLPSPKREFDQSLFSPAEIGTLEYVATKFKDHSAREIAEISHNEPAWKDNIEGKRIIPFYYAFELESA